ncbi:uncharacterized protein MKK02DRAFT_41938 [Dioszegia hungarica]|uniref:N-acetyltransferase domain-containing protein n=1 Tax=Dioszegia hungarica TaxID=4972 RepID=A0AA38LYF1_9TREE|nr:uncharacterized protein MKK02DRAFT_41938 [Dioszegia hungarica]KAI9638911.1 hypothetical protein MKK02DRAFT_41938 [Dioszegia hungarica]
MTAQTTLPTILTPIPPSSIEYRDFKASDMDWFVTESEKAYTETLRLSDEDRAEFRKELLKIAKGYVDEPLPDSSTISETYPNETRMQVTIDEPLPDDSTSAATYPSETRMPVATVDGKPVGTVLLQFYVPKSPKEGGPPLWVSHLSHLITREAYRKRGVARAMMRHVELELAPGGIQPFITLDALSCAPFTVDFYKSCGFTSRRDPESGVVVSKCGLGENETVFLHKMPPFKAA